MICASLLIGERGWIWPAAAAAAVAFLVLGWAYRSLGFAGRVRFAALGLKVLAVALLTFSLVEPLWSGTRARPGANIFAILVDTSQSLQIHDSGNKQTRGHPLQSAIRNEKAPWQVRLAQDFDLRRYRFDSRLQQTASFAKLEFKGNATSLRMALDDLRERFAGRPFAGVLLFTDGNATDWTGIEFQGLPPIYPVILGSGQSIKDILIDNVSVSQTAFEDAPVTIRADISAAGFDGKEVIAQLVDENGKLIEQSSQTAENDDKPLTFRFQFRPAKPGISFYSIRAAAADEIAQFEKPETSHEATVANNTRVVKVDRGQGPHRVLYVSGRPNWEYKFLRRAVEEDDQIDLVGLIRIAKREAKFDFRGRTGESSNSLFRGFKKESDAETENFDQPVLIRLNTKDAAELQGGFPKSEEELFGYDAVILDDLEAEFLSFDQMELLQRFVSERGGGFLMLGGQESFLRGGYRRTPVGEMLPVYLDRVSEGRPDSRYKLLLTRDGWLQPWARLRSNELDERDRMNEMPPFRTLNRVGSLKPGATAISHVTDAAGTLHPALVVQRFGRGRSGAVMIGDLWRWRLRENHDIGNEQKDKSSDQEKAWRQMLRWLIVDVPQPVEVRVKPAPGVAGAAVELQVRIRDSEFKPLDNAGVSVKVTPPDGKEISLEADPSAEEAGLYTAIYVPRKSGVFRSEIAVNDADAKKLGKIETGWATDPAAAEFRSVSPNHALLKELAEKTGGEVIPIEDLDDFSESLSSRKVPVTERWTYPLWHQAWFFMAAVGCLVGEWGLRRWKGLP